MRVVSVCPEFASSSFACVNVCHVRDLMHASLAFLVWTSSSWNSLHTVSSVEECSHSKHTQSFWTLRLFVNLLASIILLWMSVHSFDTLKTPHSKNPDTLEMLFSWAFSFLLLGHFYTNLNIETRKPTVLTEHHQLVGSFLSEKEATNFKVPCIFQRNFFPLCSPLPVSINSIAQQPSPQFSVANSPPTIALNNSFLNVGLAFFNFLSPCSDLFQGLPGCSLTCCVQISPSQFLWTPCSPIFAVSATWPVFNAPTRHETRVIDLCHLLEYYELHHMLAKNPA